MAPPPGVQFELHTLPVDERAIPDGDGLTLYVSADEPMEKPRVPKEVTAAMEQRRKARVQLTYELADKFLDKIKMAGYSTVKIGDGEVLRRKYRIRLRGIDAPELAMPYGEEARDELVNIIEGKCLTVQVYCTDRYGRKVGDVYCNGVFVQELMLRRGCAWHYSKYDNRLELARWQNEARAQGVGLWVLPNPEKPWDWRKVRREGR